MYDDVGPSPPWYVYDAAGEICVLDIPDRLLQHPELEQRGLVSKLRDTLKPGCVYCTPLGTIPGDVVKILDPNTEEVYVQQRLLREINRPNNHTLPSEMTATGHPLLIMPMVSTMERIGTGRRDSISGFLDVMFQMIEARLIPIFGIEFLHSLKIVHMDVCMGNMLTADACHANAYHQIVAGRLYIIDFGQSRQFALGPGVQPAITLPETQMIPPKDLLHFDPYSWDMYCAGVTMEWLLKYNLTHKGWAAGSLWFANKLVQWLIGDERGCTGVCHCRPTARTALRVLIFLRWAVCAVDGYDYVVRAMSQLWTTHT
ncbi:hypothetical protein C2E23DRAFT_719669 [Lenzites betulinus]|nr:hypothetical protein C2E23DRAFT_719669 [Lenzites betulinus]